MTSGAPLGRKKWTPPERYVYDLLIPLDRTQEKKETDAAYPGKAENTKVTRR